jgi:hypothetical protein
MGVIAAVRALVETTSELESGLQEGFVAHEGS